MATAASIIVGLGLGRRAAKPKPEHGAMADPAIDIPGPAAGATEATVP